MLLVHGPYRMMLTNLLDFNVGVLCLRTILKCALKAIAYFVYGIE